MESNRQLAQAKTNIRKPLLEARAALTSEELDGARAAIRDHVVTKALSAGWRKVAAYEATRTEPGSAQLLTALAELGIDVIVPILLGDRDLDWRVWPNGEALGLDAVTAVDAVLVPALAVSSSGIRLGRGGGSYDRALRRVSSTTPIAAVLFDSELVDELPHAEWDIPVTSVVTPSGWHLR